MKPVKPYKPAANQTNALRSVMLGPLELTFYRTCRVPRAEGLINELPAGLGTFPVYRVKDYASGAPKDWKPEGHFIPMWAHEAMWIDFNRPQSPVALLVGAGMVNAVTGTRLTEELSGSPQNYLVIPPQPWLDGFKPTSGEKVYQFVAAELGSGETAEEQILGTAEFGGLQFGVVLPKIDLIPASRPREYVTGGEYYLSYRTRGGDFKGTVAQTREMGLGAGGSIRQKIYRDPYLQGRPVNEVWHREPHEKAYVYIVHSADFKAITGREPPPSPITYQTYQQQGLPWFGLPDGTWGDVAGGKPIDELKPVSGNPDAVNATPTKSEPNPETKKLW